MKHKDEILEAHMGGTVGKTLGANNILFRQKTLLALTTDSTAKSEQNLRRKSNYIFLSWLQNLNFLGDHKIQRKLQGFKRKRKQTRSQRRKNYQVRKKNPNMRLKRNPNTRLTTLWEKTTKLQKQIRLRIFLPSSPPVT